MAKDRKDILFEATAELTAVYRDRCRFRVGPNTHDEKDKTGLVNVTNLTHLDIPREHFPDDDDFSLDFINADLDELAETDWKDDDKALSALKKKQKKFAKFAGLKIVMFR